MRKGLIMALKRSRQREMIKSFLMGRKDHPTADVIYSNLKQQDPNLSLGTVYRNLTLLSDMGEILRLRVGDGVDHFDADTSEHYHFVCTECGSVIDLDMDSIDSIMETAGERFDGGSGDMSLISMALVPPAPGLLRSPSFLNENWLRSIIYLCL